MAKGAKLLLSRAVQYCNAAHKHLNSEKVFERGTLTRSSVIKVTCNHILHDKIGLVYEVDLLLG